MAVKLHRCSFGWLQFDICSRVQSALDDMGIEYEVVVHPISRRKRQGMIELSGQKYYPVIEFEDGSIYREQSKDMAATIRAGKLDEKRGRRYVGLARSSSCSSSCAASSTSLCRHSAARYTHAIRPVRCSRRKSPYTKA